MPPIEHVVIIVKENHTFDNYFGPFAGAHGVSLPAAPDPHPDQNHDHAAWLAAAAGSGGVKQQYGPKNIPATCGNVSTFRRRRAWLCRVSRRPDCGEPTLGT